MKVAICLYGQPRHYRTGHSVLSKFMEEQSGVSFDIFYHVWKEKDNSSYDASPWRKINQIHLHVENSRVICHEVGQLYRPKECMVEESIHQFGEYIYQDTLAYRLTTNPTMRKNINNTLSQLYSRNQVRNVFATYIYKTGKKYDMVIMCRFDFLKKPSIRLNQLDTQKVYVGNMHKTSKLIPDNFIVCPQDVFLNWFNIYHDLPEILNNTELANKMSNYNILLRMNAEELIFAKFLYHYDINLIVYTPLICNFI